MPNKYQSVEYWKSYREKNKDVIRGKAKAYYTNTSGDRKKQAKRWYAENKEKRKETMKIWYLGNKERTLSMGKKYRVKNKEKYRAYCLKKNYGVDVKWVDEKRLHQNNRCEICGTPFIKTPFVDHNHSTGKVRGLLCSRCNLGLGIFSDNIVTLRNAVIYIEKYAKE